SMAHRRCPVGRSRPRPTSATTCRPRSESIISVSNYRELLLVASDLAATVSLNGRRRWFDDQGVDSGVREPGVDRAPAATSVDALLKVSSQVRWLISTLPYLLAAIESRESRRAISTRISRL